MTVPAIRREERVRSGVDSKTAVSHVKPLVIKRYPADQQQYDSTADNWKVLRDDGARDRGMRYYDHHETPSDPSYYRYGDAAPYYDNTLPENPRLEQYHHYGGANYRAPCRPYKGRNYYKTYPQKTTYYDHVETFDQAPVPRVPWTRDNLHLNKLYCEIESLLHGWREALINSITERPKRVVFVDARMKDNTIIEYSAVHGIQVIDCWGLYPFSIDDVDNINLISDVDRHYMSDTVNPANLVKFIYTWIQEVPIIVVPLLNDDLSKPDGGLELLRCCTHTYVYPKSDCNRCSKQRDKQPAAYKLRHGAEIMCHRHARLCREDVVLWRPIVVALNIQNDVASLLLYDEENTFIERLTCVEPVVAQKYFEQKRLSNPSTHTKWWTTLKSISLPRLTCDKPSDHKSVLSTAAQRLGIRIAPRHYGTYMNCVQTQMICKKFK